MTLAKKILRERQSALESVFITTNAFVWLIFSIVFLQSHISEVTTNAVQAQGLLGIYFGSLMASFIIGAMLINRVERKQFFLVWTLMGVLSPFALLILNFTHFPAAVIISVLFAASAGFGMPSCMQYFTRSTNIGKRGSYAGLVIFLSLFLLFFFRVIDGGIESTILILAVWRSLGLLGLLTAKSFKEPVEKVVNYSYRSILHQRSFVLYFVPWLMFSLVNYLSVPIQMTILNSSTFSSMQIICDITSALSALPAGFLIDYKGRKPCAVAGFVLLGLSYSFLGLYPQSTLSWYFYSVFDGVTWGILSVLFVTCIWGELNQHVSSEKYYAIGILPFFISEFISISLTNTNFLGISAYALFSFIAIFLFLAVVPLIYAPETLPDKLMKDRDLQSYAEKALKKAQSQEQQRRSSKESGKEDLEFLVDKKEEDEEEYEKAKQLAEKYY